jgi:uncharacterized protein (TIGR03086 family)
LEAADFHLAVCSRFADAVRYADGRWQRPSPCDGWNANDVLEHVIGFHDVLLLRPLGSKTDRPHDVPQQRWELTFNQVRQTLSRADVFQRVVEIPAVGTRPATQLDVGELLPRLTQDVLVHTWDLARAVGGDDQLDPQWCATFLNRLPADPNVLSGSGMFAAPVTIDDAADPQSRLLARLGRDPSWRPRE